MFVPIADLYQFVTLRAVASGGWVRKSGFRNAAERALGTVVELSRKNSYCWYSIIKSETQMAEDGSQTEFT